MFVTIAYFWLVSTGVTPFNPWLTGTLVLLEYLGLTVLVSNILDPGTTDENGNDLTEWNDDEE